MTRNNADFHGVSFSHTMHGDGGALIHATHLEHGTVGHLLLRFPIDGQREVKNIAVNESHRRKGIATGMWNYAQQQGLNPEHSDSRTKDGDAWAASTGDYVPENNGIHNPDAPQRWD